MLNGNCVTSDSTLSLTLHIQQPLSLFKSATQFFLFFVFFFGHAVRLRGFYFPDQGSNPGPQQ